MTHRLFRWEIDDGEDGKIALPMHFQRLGRNSSPIPTRVPENRRLRKSKSAVHGSRPKLEIRRSTVNFAENEQHSYNPFLQKVGSVSKLPNEKEISNLVREMEQNSSFSILVECFEDNDKTKPRETEGSPANKTCDADGKRLLNSKNFAKRKSCLNISRPVQHLEVPEDDTESITLRNFDLGSKGRLINRGDSIRKKQERSRSTTSIPTSETERLLMNQINVLLEPNPEESKIEITRKFNVILIGQPGTGKEALIDQFMSSECIDAYNPQSNGETTSKLVHVQLNDVISEIEFSVHEGLNVNTIHVYCLIYFVPKFQSSWISGVPPDGFLLCYSIIDKGSLQIVEEMLSQLQAWDLLKGRPSILVGNKIDLVRKRTVSQQGKCLASAYNCKWIEISVAISHNVDELLVGLVAQLQLYRDRLENPKPLSGSNAKMVKITRRMKQAFTKMLGYASENNAYKHCENLYSL